VPYKNEICFPYLTGSYFCSSNCSRLDSVNHEFSFSRKVPQNTIQGQPRDYVHYEITVFKSTLLEPHLAPESCCGHRCNIVQICIMQQKLRPQTKIFCLDAQTHKGKVKESRNRTGVAQRIPGGLGSQSSWHSPHEGGEIVNLIHRPPLPPGVFLVLIFTRG
jgi:hypothetical protein